MTHLDRFKVRAFLLILAAVVLLLVSLASTAQANPDSPLNPGDILTVSLPGETAFSQPFKVAADGTILLPEVGQIAVAGQTLKDVRAVIREKLATTYKGLDRLAIHLKERRLAVTVLGYVENPGPQNLAAGATIQMAINAAGGIKIGAQLDNLQVRRGTEVLTFNYKQYLDSGNPSLIPKLQPLDEVFVPASPLTGNVEVDFDARTLTAAGDAADEGQAVIVFGEVHRPGSFAYKPGNSVIDMIMRAGGVTRYATVDQIKIISQGTPQAFNLRAYLENGQTELMPDLSPGDTIYVPQIVEQLQAGGLSVKVIGAVNRPGRYEWTEDMSLLDLIAISGGTKASADTAFLRIIKSTQASGQGGQTFDMKNFLEEGGKLDQLPIVSPGDTLVVPELPKDPNDNRSQWTRQSSDRSIYIFGGVVAPGRYAFNQNLGFLDILAAAQGPSPQADLRNVRITHRNQEGAKVSHIDLSLYLKTGDESLLPQVKPEDVIYVPLQGQDWRDLSKEQTIRVLGAVGSPGRYSFEAHMTILDLLAEAGGPSAHAWQERIVVVSSATEKPQARTFDLLAFAQNGDYQNLPVLQEGDTIFVPNREQSDWAIITKGMTDAVTVLSLVRLITSF